MSNIFVNRFITSIYNERIKINNDFDIDEIIKANNTLPIIPESQPDVNNKPPINDDVKGWFKYELNRYARGNVQLIDKAILNANKATDPNGKILNLKKYVLRNLLIDKLFGTNLRKEIGIAKRTIFLFPTYDNDTKGKDKLLDDISENYEWLFDLPNFTTNPIRFYLNDKLDEGIDIGNIQTKLQLSTNQFTTVNKQNFNHLLFPNNAIIFLPVINPTEDEASFETRMNGILQQILQSIESESKVIEGQLIREEKIPFSNISYAVYDDKDNEMFTDYYKDKLGSKKKNILKKLLDETFKRGATIGKQTVQVNNTKKNQFQIMSVEQADKDFMYFTSSTYRDLLNNDDFLTLKDSLNQLINKFKDYSKRSENLQYSISATSDENTNFLRVFYRVNNMDVPVTVDLVRTGTNYLYRLEGVKLDSIDQYDNLKKSAKSFPNGLYVGFLFKNKLSTTKNIYRFQVHILKTQQLRKITNPNSENDDKTENEDEATEATKETDIKSAMIQIMKNNLTGEITFQKSGSRDNLKGFGLNLKGSITEYQNLHIYELYRWFRFNHIDGSLSDETNIRFFPDILFDRKTFIEFLKSKNAYDEKKTRIPYEFLKINKDVTQLLEYSEFIQENYKSTHTYNPSILGRFTASSLEELSFENSIKSGLLELIFTPINVIYVGKPPSTSIGEKDTSKNYKIVSYQEYKPSGFRTLLDTENVKYQYADFYRNTLQQVISGDDEEYKYCDKHLLEKCEIMKEFFTKDYLKYLSDINLLKYNEEQLVVLNNIPFKDENEKNIKTKPIIEAIKQLNESIKAFEDKDNETYIEKKINLDKRDKKKFINNKNQHISMAIVTVTQEDINRDNFNTFLTKNKCKTLRRNIKRDLKGVRADIVRPVHSTLAKVSFGGNTVKNKMKLKKLKKRLKNKKIKPFKNTKKNKKIKK